MAKAAIGASIDLYIDIHFLSLLSSFEDACELLCIWVYSRVVALGSFHSPKIQRYVGSASGPPYFTERHGTERNVPGPERYPNPRNGTVW